MNAETEEMQTENAEAQVEAPAKSTHEDALEAIKAKFATNKSFMIIGGALAIAALITGIFFWYLQTHASYDQEYRSLAAEQQVLSQEIAKFALEAARGSETGFENLEQRKNRFITVLNILKKGSDSVPATAEGAPNAAGALEDLDKKSWNNFEGAVSEILNGRESMLLVGQAVMAIQANLPNLTDYSEKVVNTMVNNNASREDIYKATRQLMLAQRIANHLNKVLSGGEGIEETIEMFEEDVQTFGETMEEMLEEQEAAEALLRDISMFFTVIYHNVEEILDRSEQIIHVQSAAEDATQLSDKLLADIAILNNEYERAAEARPIKPGFGMFMMTVTGALLIALGVLIFKDSKDRQHRAEEEQRLAQDRMEEEAEQNQRNQEAILRMLDEMGDLADGDLTVEVTVTEDFTGAIADSVNFAIEELRGLVRTINETTVQVSSSAEETQATAIHLAEASDHQAQQITSASAAINEMAVSIDQVSKNADESVEVARKSVETAHNGGDTVRKTIEGMNQIREQIQETSKRIKRLGESSQEIGDIVELINDISDQTNILALNAAIQAAMAGEAGRGFAVVADEVQRLAERSGNATKQIEALVKTIQGDTNEAVISMEQTTSNVVSGARMAEQAGSALDEIESVSKNLADLIQGISESARQQANAASNISDTMNVIQEITTQTSAGTNETATSIGNLAELANELRKSVSGFKLPE